MLEQLQVKPHRHRPKPLNLPPAKMLKPPNLSKTKTVNQPHLPKVVKRLNLPKVKPMKLPSLPKVKNNPLSSFVKQQTKPTATICAVGFVFTTIIPASAVPARGNKRKSGHFQSAVSLAGTRLRWAERRSYPTGQSRYPAAPPAMSIRPLPEQR